MTDRQMKRKVYFGGTCIPSLLYLPFCFKSMTIMLHLRWFNWKHFYITVDLRGSYIRCCECIYLCMTCIYLCRKYISKNIPFCNHSPFFCNLSPFFCNLNPFFSSLLTCWHIALSWSGYHHETVGGTGKGYQKTKKEKTEMNSTPTHIGKRNSSRYYSKRS